MAVSTHATSGAGLDPRVGQGRIKQAALLLLGLCVISAVAFIAQVRHPVFDEVFHLPEARRYATMPITLESLRQQGVPTGPASFLWMILGGRLLGDHLWSYRAMVLLAWLLFAAGLLMLARRRGHENYLYFALLFTLVFPHTPTAFATLLTEGPALLLATMGTLLWIGSIWSEEASSRNLVTSLIGAFLAGLAAVTRQYYLALLPAMFLVLAVRAWRMPHVERKEILARALSLATALIPILCLWWVWGGITSPGMAIGTSYPGFVARSGLDPIRPLIAAFYVLIYSIPLFWPLLFGGSLKTKLLWGLGGVSMTVAASYAGVELTQLGPVKAALDRFFHGGISELFVECALAGIGSAVVGQLAAVLYRRRDEFMTAPVVLLSVFVIVFFVAEQIGVGGNIPFYERYLLQLAPFLGVIRGYAIPRVRIADITIWIAMAGAGQLMLWRYS